MRQILASLRECAGDVVFGMEDGTVSIFGLVAGVAASASDTRAVLVAGCSGACAAAISMMAGVFLEAQTQAEAGQATASPLARALWMLLADFLAAAVPILPFALLPIGSARIAATAITLGLLALLGFGRARLAGKPALKPILQTISVGSLAAIAGIAAGWALGQIA